MQQCEVLSRHTDNPMEAIGTPVQCGECGRQKSLHAARTILVICA